jgi:hypothetical protein
MKKACYLLLLLILCGSCRDKNPPVEEPPTPELPTPIGQGVEIYPAKFTWAKNDRGRKTLITKVELISNTPTIPYDEINYYTKFETYDMWQTGITFSKDVFILNSEGRIINTQFGDGKVVIPPDTAYAVTLDKKILFGCYLHLLPPYIDNVVMNVITSSKSEYQFKNNAIALLRNTLPITTFPNPELSDDPRFDKALLDRFRKDGKLKF